MYVFVLCVCICYCEDEARVHNQLYLEQFEYYGYRYVPPYLSSQILFSLAFFPVVLEIHEILIHIAYGFLVVIYSVTYYMRGPYLKEGLASKVRA